MLVSLLTLLRLINFVLLVVDINLRGFVDFINQGSDSQEVRAVFPKVTGLFV